MVPENVTEEPMLIDSDESPSDMDEVLRKCAVRLCAELMETERGRLLPTFTPSRYQW